MIKLILYEQGDECERTLYEGDSIDEAMKLIQHIIILRYRDESKRRNSVYFDIKDKYGFNILELHYNKTGII